MLFNAAQSGRCIPISAEQSRLIDSAARGNDIGRCRGPSHLGTLLLEIITRLEVSSVQLILFDCA
jgi:hypothetical protein